MLSNATDLVRKDSIEEWRPVLGCEGLYDVSSLGRVRRVGKAARTGKGRGGGAVIGRILSTSAGKDGYLRAHLWAGGHRTARLVHVLVAQVFLLPRPSVQHEVNHIDGVKSNCAADNLEWVTRKQNMLHAWKIGLLLLTEAQLVALAKSREPDVISRRSDTQRGLKRSDETRAKIAAAFTPERRRKLSEDMRKRRAG